MNIRFSQNLLPRSSGMNLILWITALCIYWCSNEALGKRTKRDVKPYKMVCYWDTRSVSRPGDGKFTPSDIDSTLCTHLVLKSVKLGQDKLLNFNSNFDPDNLDEVFELRKQNPDLKILLSLDDLSESSRSYLNYPDLESFENQLLQGVDAALQAHSFDGVDLDLSQPDIHGESPNIDTDILEVLQTLRSYADENGIILSALVSADEITMDTAYDIPNIDKLVDFTNLMTFNYHGGAERFTGMNAPMYPGNGDYGDDAHLNVDWTIKHWLSKGGSASKTVLGVASYGRTFTLRDKSQFGVGAPVIGYGKAGPFLLKAGIQAYNELCDSVANHGWNVDWDPVQQTPWAYMDDQWIGYDDDGSVNIKGKYIVQENLAGAMLWTMDMDDFRSNCGQNAFPLLRQLYHSLEDYDGPDPGPGPNPHPKPEPLVCIEPGFFPNPYDCTKFYRCVVQGNQITRFDFDCGPGTVYNPKIFVCDWPYNVPGCE